MKRNHILCISMAMALGSNLALYAQDNVVSTEKSPLAIAKKAENKYPTIEVKGRVVDAATNTPLIGVQVQSLGNARYSAMSDENGEFTINVPEFETTLFAFSPSYLSQKVAIDHQDKQVSISMISDRFREMYVNDTEILAAPTVKVNNTTGLSAETSLAENLNADVRSISRSGGPGYGNAMFIRGLNSLNANAQPLIVIDGVEQDVQLNRGALHDGDFTNFLLYIRPEDIASIQVLKNGTALYGAKGGNGVILINTKRGYSRATRIEANVGVGITTIPNLPDMMDENQFRSYAAEMLSTIPNINNYGPFRFLNDDQSKFYYRTYHGNNTDWSKEVYRTAMTQNYSLNVQGGDEVGMYNLSLGYTDAQSTAKENGLDRLSARFNSDITILSNLKTRFDMSFSKVNREVFDNGAPEDFTAGPVSSPTLLGLIKAPFLSPYVISTFTGKESEVLYGSDDYLTGAGNVKTGLPADLSLGNPTALLKNGSGVNKNRTEMTHFNATIAPRYEFNSNWSLTETFSYTYDYVSQRYYRPKNGMPTFQIPNIGTVENMSMAYSSSETSLVSDTRLAFKKTVGAHKWDAFAGLRFTSFSYEQNTPKGQYSSGGNDKNPSISNNMQFKEATGANDVWKGLAWYGQVGYNYRNLYFAEATLTMEANSRFGENAGAFNLGGVGWGLFPGIQLGWAISSEEWFPKNQAINNLLLRAGYDISGNDDISTYAARTSFNIMKYLFQTNAIQLNNIGNDKIQWEETGKFNVGFSTSLLKNRLTIDFDYYMNHTSNLLTLKRIDNPLIGVNQYWSNGGSLDNRGVEVSVTGKPVMTRNFNIELGASMGHYKNEVKSLPSGDYLSSIYGTDNVLTAVGKPIGVFYGYQTNGVFASDEAARAGIADAKNPEGYLYIEDRAGQRQYFHAGDVHFRDRNEDGKITELDRTVIGDPNPDIYGNLFGKFTWKNLSLSAVFNYSLGGEVFNYMRSVLEGGSNFYNQTTSMTNRWRTEGQVTDMPRIEYGDAKGNSRFSDRWIEDGSFLRLKTLNLTYRIPANLTWLQGMSIWAEANNLFTLTKYLGSDPEFSVSNASLYQGIDAGNVALSPSFTVGVKINL